MKNCDVIVVGCGLSGAVVARMVAEKGYSVKILEKRNHIGGNMYDYYDEHNILVHKYGPHTFHTNNEKVFSFISRFSKWKEYKLTCGAQINGKCTPTPFNFQTVDDFFPSEKAKLIKEHLKICFPDKATVTVLEALDCDDLLVKEYAQFLFDNDYSLYTAKQWGVSPSDIDKSVLKRVPLRLSYEVGYFDDKYQLMPEKTYTDFFENMLNHNNISLEMGVDALEVLSVDEKNSYVRYKDNVFAGVLVYTGPLDELFGFRYGQLPYRSLEFDIKYEYSTSKQDMPVVAYPQAEGYTRIVEYKKLPIQEVEGTTFVVEYPKRYEPNKNQEPYYPVLTDSSCKQYEMYLDFANQIKRLVLCGRLADFKYYNMDQALEKALAVSERVLDLLKS